MRVGTVGPDGDDRRVMRDQPSGRELLEDEALDVALAVRSAALGTAANAGERGIDDGAHRIGRARVAGELLDAPDRLEALHEIGG